MVGKKWMAPNIYPGQLTAYSMHVIQYEQDLYKYVFNSSSKSSHISHSHFQLFLALIFSLIYSCVCVVDACVCLWWSWAGRQNALLAEKALQTCVWIWHFHDKKWREEEHKDRQIDMSSRLSCILLLPSSIKLLLLAFNLSSFPCCWYDVN